VIGVADTLNDLHAVLDRPERLFELEADPV
jgi:hypothetical protein